MWTTNKEDLEHVHGQRFWISIDSRPASVADVLQGWQCDGDFRDLFNSILASVPSTAFRWETPGVTSETLRLPFEFVVLDSPELVRRPDQDAFSEHFDNANAGIAVFQNLGGDATLIVPLPLAHSSAYGHLAAFVRLAPEPQRHSLWQSVGQAMVRRIGTKPVWLSTAGAGVSWLHIRLDDRPKYYGYGPYKRHEPPRG